MNAEQGRNSVPSLPRCPQCAQAMRLLRKTPRPDGLPDLLLFGCETCRETHFEEGAPVKDGAKQASTNTIGSWYVDEFGNPTREIKSRD
jgi:hypothetical protein